MTLARQAARDRRAGCEHDRRLGILPSGDDAGTSAIGASLVAGHVQRQGPECGAQRAATEDSSSRRPTSLISGTDPETHAVFIATRHDLHAELVMAAFESGKHVFVEKPLCVNEEELERIRGRVEELGEACPILMVGFNRRFAPATARCAPFLAIGAVHGHVPVRGRLSAA